jgi:hypothetical protein
VKWLNVVAGIAMIGVASHDIFHTLFHPAGRGAMSDQLSRWVWRLVRAAAKKKEDLVTLGGPFIFLSIVATWALLIVVGFALIYHTHMQTYAVAPGMNPATHMGFLDALNVSLGSLITLAGDFNSRSKLFRLLMGLEAVLGFGLLTASVSWLLSIYPVLEQRHSLAHQATLMHEAERVTGTSIFNMNSSELHTVITEITTEIVILRNSMAQFPVSYYFRGGDKKMSLPGILEYIRGIGLRAAESRDPAIRISGTMLGGAVIDLLHLIADVFLEMPADDPAAVAQAYARDHLRDLVPYEA